MKSRLRHVLTVFIILLISISLASCHLTTIFAEDDDREEDHEETEEETEDETSDITESLEPSSEEPSTPTAPETVETSEEDLAASVEGMLPVLDAIAYVMAFESETGIYDSGDTNFTAKVLYIGTQLHGSTIFNDTEDAGGTRTVSYADIEEFANACFDTLTVDITIEDEYGRLTYSEAENVFYAALGDGEYESEIASITSLGDGTISVQLNVIAWESVIIFTFTLLENDFVPAFGTSRYPYSVSSAEGGV